MAECFVSGRGGKEIEVDYNNQITNYAYGSNVSITIDPNKKYLLSALGSSWSNDSAWDRVYMIDNMKLTWLFAHGMRSTGQQVPSVTGNTISMVGESGWGIRLTAFPIK